MNMRSNNGNFEKYKSEMLRMYQQQNRPMNSANTPQNSFPGGLNQRGYAQNSKNRNDNVLSNLNAQLGNMAGSSDPNEQGLESSLQLDDDFPPASYRQDISSHTVRGDTPIEYDNQGMRTSDLIFDNSDQNAGSANARQVQAPENLSISPENGSYFTHRGMLSIKQERWTHSHTPLDPECNCKVCRTYTKAYLRHIFKEQEILSSILASYHNLYFLHNMIHEIRAAINEDRFEEYRKNFLEKFHSGVQE